MVLNVLRLIATHPLNQGQRSRAVIRFMKWQIGSRMVPGAIVYEWVNGSKFLVRTGETGLTGNIYVGLHEFADMAFLLHVLRDHDLFIDVGANAGSYTILACCAIGARGYDFEPIPGTYHRLVENVRLNRAEHRVECLNVGVGREQGRIAFTSGADAVNHVVAPGERCDNPITVEVTTLVTVLVHEAPSSMKIDVEGYETPVVEGALETLKKPSLHSVIMELNGSGSRYGFDESRTVETMLNLGFETYSYSPLDRSLASLQGKNSDSGNTLFIRDKSFILERLKTSPRIEINGREF